MSGPSLNKLDSHRSIHDGVISEGRDLMEVLLKVYEQKHEKHSLIAVQVLIEHWETRLLAHADSEEEGLYIWREKQHPELLKELTMLKRDHELLRILVNEAKEEVAKKGVCDEVIDYLTAIYVLARIHNREEEMILFVDEKQADSKTS